MRIDNAPHRNNIRLRQNTKLPCRRAIAFDDKEVIFRKACRVSRSAGSRYDNCCVRALRARDADGIKNFGPCRCIRANHFERRNTGR